MAKSSGGGGRSGRSGGGGGAGGGATVESLRSQRENISAEIKANDKKIGSIREQLRFRSQNMTETQIERLREQQITLGSRNVDLIGKDRAIEQQLTQMLPNPNMPPRGASRAVIVNPFKRNG